MQYFERLRIQVVESPVRVGNHNARAVVAVLHKALGTTEGAPRSEIEFRLLTGRHLRDGDGFLSADFPNAQVKHDFCCGAQSRSGEIRRRDLLSVRREARTDEQQELPSESLGRNLKCAQLRRQSGLSVRADEEGKWAKTDQQDRTQSGFSSTLVDWRIGRNFDSIGHNVSSRYQVLPGVSASTRLIAVRGAILRRFQAATPRQ